MATTKKTTSPGFFTSVQNFIRRALGQGDDVGPGGVFLSAVLVLGGAALLIWLLLASFGVGNAFFASGPYHGSRFVGVIWLLVLAFWAWINFSERIPFKVSDMAWILSLVIGIILLVLYNSGHLF